MPADMKETIARAALALLFECHVKKLTVKDIVEQCHITRQAFYYHFEDIPELFRWMMEQLTQLLIEEALSKGNAEEGLRCFFVMAAQMDPYVKRGMDSNYRTELEQLLREFIGRFFAALAESQDYYRQCTAAEAKFLCRYHTLAVLGLLQEWTDRDTERLDEIVSMVCRLMKETPAPPAEG